MSRAPPLGPKDFARIFPVTGDTLARLGAYAGLLTQWSATINLVSHDSLADLWRRHILDSAQLYRFVPRAACSIVDLGTGAGLPGLVLAMLGARGVELIEADRRKVAFLREAARITAADVKISAGRIEEIAPRPADVVTARACARLDRLLDLAERFIAPETVCLFPKGERFEEELTIARKAWTMAVSVKSSLSDRRGVVVRLQQVAREPGQRRG